MAKSGLPVRTVTAAAPRDILAPELDPRPSRLARRSRRRDTSRRHLVAAAAKLTLFLSDTLALLFAFSAASRFQDEIDRGDALSRISSDSHQLLIGLSVAASLAVFGVTGMYGGRRSVSRTDELYRVATRVTFGLVIAIAGTSLILGDEFAYSRQMLAYGWMLAIIVVTAGRFVHDALIGTLRTRGIATDRLLIVGTGSTGSTVLHKVRHVPRLGYDLIGFVRHELPGESSPTEINGVPVLGTTSDLAQVVETYKIDELIIALSGTPHEEILDLAYAVTDYPVAIRVFPDTFRLLTTDTLNVADLGGLPTVSVRTIGLRPIDRALKRTMDIIVSGAMLVAFAPLTILIAFGIKLSSRGPVFYIQERVGQDGRAFHLIKFRTMRADAEVQSGPVFATPDDPRRTRIGRLLRRYSLDELPQFINVLLGEMSVVGPRPERPYFVEQFSLRIPAYMARHHEKSGITGWAQVNGLRGDTSIEERTRYDLYYVENWSILFDIRIMIRTLAHIFSRGNNAY